MSTELKMTPGSISTPSVDMRAQGLREHCQTHNSANTSFRNDDDAIEGACPKEKGLALLPGSQIPQRFQKRASELLLL